MSRNYRELAAQRLAELTETRLEIEQLKAEILELKAVDADHRKINGELREGIAHMKADIDRQIQVNSATNEQNIRLGEDIAAQEGLLKAHRSLLKRIYWFLVSYPIEADMAAVSARQGLLEDLEKMAND